MIDTNTLVVMMMGATCLMLIFIAAIATVGVLYILNRQRPAQAPMGEQQMMLTLLRQIVDNSEQAGSRLTLTDVALKDFENKVGKPFLDHHWRVETWWTNPTVAGYATFILRKDENWRGRASL